MKLKKFADYIGAAQYSRRRWHLFILLLIITLTAELMVTTDHGVFTWQQLPGWNALLGFIFCGSIIFACKLLGHYCGLKQDEDYYDDEIQDGEKQDDD